VLSELLTLYSTFYLFMLLADTIRWGQSLQDKHHNLITR
jgi:hypothetical protein